LYANFYLLTRTYACLRVLTRTSFPATTPQSRSSINFNRNRKFKPEKPAYPLATVLLTDKILSLQPRSRINPHINAHLNEESDYFSHFKKSRKKVSSVSAFSLQSQMPPESLSTLFLASRAEFFDSLIQQLAPHLNPLRVEPKISSQAFSQPLNTPETITSSRRQSERHLRANLFPQPFSAPIKGRRDPHNKHLRHSAKS
jgi:hypothetical protein